MCGARIRWRGNESGAVSAVRRSTLAAVFLCCIGMPGCDGGDVGPDAAPSCEVQRLPCPRSEQDLYSLCGAVQRAVDGARVLGPEQADLTVEVYDYAAFLDQDLSAPVAIASLDDCGRYRALDFSPPEYIVVVTRGASDSTTWTVTAHRTSMPDTPPDDFDLLAISRTTDEQWSTAALGSGEATYRERGATLFVLTHGNVPVAGVTASGGSFPTIAYLEGNSVSERALPVASGGTRANGSVLTTSDLDQISFSGAEPPGCNWVTLGGFSPPWPYYRVDEVAAQCPP